jgi:riboflavin synthase
MALLTVWNRVITGYKRERADLKEIWRGDRYTGEAEAASILRSKLSRSPCMFTGLIQELGTLQSVPPGRLHVTCAGKMILLDLAIGDSIAVDGACLTVETILPRGFVVSISAETLHRTTLERQAESSAWVNLEAALRVGSKLGGHFVTGHIDGIGRVETLEQRGESWEIGFVVPGAIARYIVPKGSIAVNGISLTVSECNPQGNWFKVAVIPHSFAHTNLRYLRIGSPVNLETDLLGKYADKLLDSQRSSSLSPEAGESPLSGISAEFLAEHGFI